MSDQEWANNSLRAALQNIKDVETKPLHAEIERLRGLLHEALYHGDTADWAKRARDAVGPYAATAHPTHDIAGETRHIVDAADQPDGLLGPWAQAPKTTQWGADMVEAVVAIGRDHTAHIYVDKDVAPLVADAILAHILAGTQPDDWLAREARQIGLSAAGQPSASVFPPPHDGSYWNLCQHHNPRFACALCALEPRAADPTPAPQQNAAHAFCGLFPEQSEDERTLRFLLALRCGEPGELYGDDGELQLGCFPYPIDFRRDSVQEIRRKLDARGMAKLIEQQRIAADPTDAAP